MSEEDLSQTVIQSVRSCLGPVRLASGRAGDTGRA